MSKTVKTIVTNNNNVIEAIKALKPRQFINKKEYPEYNKGLESVLDTVYSVYQARERGTATAKAESEAMAKVTEFLHTLGKANGKYISVCEATKDGNGKTTVFFDTLVYHSFKHVVYTTSNTLASLEAEKSTLSKAKAEAHTKLINGKGTATAYKEAVKKYDDILAKIEAERSKNGSENEMKIKASKTAFIKFATLELKAIINNRYSLSTEEAETMRKLRNKATKEKRTEAKPTTAKATTTTTTEAEKKTA